MYLEIISILSNKTFSKHTEGTPINLSTDISDYFLKTAKCHYLPLFYTYLCWNLNSELKHYLNEILSQAFYLAHSFSHLLHIYSLHGHQISILLIYTDHWNTGIDLWNNLFHNFSDKNNTNIIKIKVLDKCLQPQKTHTRISDGHT